MRALGIRGALGVATAAVVLVAGGSANAGTSAVREQLPDLDQETPYGLNVTAAAGRYWLGFGSAVRNVGRGPLLIDGYRPDTVSPTMTADQTIERDDGSTDVRAGVGRLQFVTSPDHRHWHYLRFDRYQLRRAGSTKVLLRDQKTGFCLGDRYRATGVSLAHAAPEKVYRTNCGLNETQLLDVHEGISVGWGDDYKPFLEGQDLPLTGLRAGRYVLVHRVNSDHHLRELSYKNNAASVLLDLRWQQGAPSLKVLRSCPNSGRCEKPLPATTPQIVTSDPRQAAGAVVAHEALASFVPDDAGLSSRPGGWADLQWNFVGPFGVDAERAWGNLIRARRPGGAGVLVAVLDTGVAYADHPPYGRSPDFAGTRFVPGWDFVDNDAYPFDENGHGTHVASTIAEDTNNGYALTGLAYGARIMPVRVLDASGDGYPSEIAQGIRYAADHKASVINMSFNFDPRIQASQIPEVVKALAYARKRGSLVVAAAGNDGAAQVAFPARSSNAVAVAATTENGCLASYSNFGGGIDLAAPGGGSDASMLGDPNCEAGRAGRAIHQMTLRLGSLTDFSVSDDYMGTSMATAHVSGIAALAIASGAVGKRPKPDAVVRRLERSARDLGAPGYDTYYGWGLVNAGTATARGPARPPAGLSRR
jgi:serine protease